MTRQFETGATRDTDDQKLDYEGFISPLEDRRVAEYMHTKRLSNIPKGQTIRSSDNWQKGIPKETYAKSLIRHVKEFHLIYDGFDAFDEKYNRLDLEEILCAIRFNVDGYLFELLKERYGRSNSECRPVDPERDSSANRPCGPMPEMSKGQSVYSKDQIVRDVPQEESNDCRQGIADSRPSGQSGYSENDGGLAEACSRLGTSDDIYFEWRSQGDGCSSVVDKGYHEPRVREARRYTGREEDIGRGHCATCS